MNTPSFQRWQETPRVSPSGKLSFRYVTPMACAATKGICWSKDGQRSLILTDSERIAAGFHSTRKKGT